MLELGLGLSLKSTLFTFNQSNHPYPNLNCVLSSSLCPGLCLNWSDHLHSCHWLPRDRHPTSAQKRVPVTSPTPPTASHLQPSTFQDKDQEEGDEVAYTYSDSDLDSSPTPKGASFTTWLVLYLLPGSSSARPDCCRSLMCLPDSWNVDVSFLEVHQFCTAVTFLSQLQQSHRCVHMDK